MSLREIEKLTQDKDCLYLLEKDREELEFLFGKDFAMMKGYSQNNPHHCYDLLEHTIRTVAAIDCDGLSENEAGELKIAALYHDVGKPKVAFEKNGKTVFYNHAAESRKIAEEVLQNFNLEEDALNRILFYIEYHDAFISFKFSSEIKDKSNPFIIPIEKETISNKIISIQKECAEKNHYIPTHRDFLLLVKLSMADAEAQSNEVFQNGVLIDSRTKKAERMKLIRSFI